MQDGTGDMRGPDWGTIRAEYEGRVFLPSVICQRHGITKTQLRYRREREGWPSIRSRPRGKDDIVARLLTVLDRQLGRLEQAKDEAMDKQVNMLAQTVKTLDKLIEMGAAERNVEPPTHKDEAELRAKLVKRLKEFNARGR